MIVPVIVPAIVKYTVMNIPIMVYLDASIALTQTLTVVHAALLTGAINVYQSWTLSDASSVTTLNVLLA